MKLFISHSSKDLILASHIVELLKSALSLRSSEIRCTSLDGYRLPGGANFEIQLRTEVLNAEVLLGIISNASVESLYVAFELGARWGHQKFLLPLMAPGSNPELLGGPLGSLNALRADSRSQLYQLVDDVAKVLKIKTESPAVYGKHIDAILESKIEIKGDVHKPNYLPFKNENEWPYLKTFDSLKRRLQKQSTTNKKIISIIAKSSMISIIRLLDNGLLLERSELVYRAKELQNQQLIIEEMLTDIAYGIHPSIIELLGENSGELISAIID